MPTILAALNCSVTKNSITIRFSEPVDSTSASALSNYTVYDPPAISGPTSLMALGTWTSVLSSDNLTVTLSSTVDAFTPGDFVLVSVGGITAVSGAALPPTDFSPQVPLPTGTGRVVRDVEDAISYPILTEEISNRPFPVSTIPGGGGTGNGGGSSSIGQLASRTVTDVLGWKVNAADPKGFIGALTQAFTLNDVEGHVQATWNAQMPAIQTDLGGSITGAQASLYMRAKDAIDRSGLLLDTLYPLDPEADPEYVKALREMIRSQMTQIVRELAVVGLPSVLRIDTYFNILLGQNPALIGTGDITFNPDEVDGTIGKLRDTYGIQFAGNPFNNSVADEVVITNFRVISDYLTSLMQSWISNRSFFFVLPDRPAFFGTQLVLISRQFNVIAETVNELRFTLDSVFIGPAERQALLLEFADPALPPRFLEGMLIEIEAFVGDEGPRLLKEGGKITVANNILPVVRALLNMVEEAHSPTNIDELPDGFRTARVRNSLDDLQDQLTRLAELVEQVEQDLPQPEDKLAVSSIVVNGPDDSGQYTVELYGEGIEPGVMAEIDSATATVLDQQSVTFYSAQRVDIDFNPSDLGLEDGLHDITLINTNGDSFILKDAITINSGVLQANSGAVARVITVNPSYRLGRRGQVAGVKSGTKKALPQKPSRSASINKSGGKAPIPPAPPAKAVGPAAGAAPPQLPSPAIANQVQGLRAAQADLQKTVDAQSQDIASLHGKMDNLLNQLNTILGQGNTPQAKLQQNTEQQQEQQDAKIRPVPPKPGK